MENEKEDDDETEETATADPTANREGSRYPLANDASGNPIKLPRNAVALRVRRGGGRRGRPRNIFNAETGQQLEIPLGASLEDLINTGVPPDRYLLYPIDEDGQIIPGVIAVTEVPATEDDDEEDEKKEEIDAEGLDPKSKNPLLALCAQQQELIKTLIEQNSRALASAVSGYAPVRPAAPVAPVIAVPEVPATLPPSSSAGVAGVLETLSKMDSEQMAKLAMVGGQVFNLFQRFVSRPAEAAAASGGP
jgi:hypothetical protein